MKKLFVYLCTFAGLPLFAEGDLPLPIPSPSPEKPPLPVEDYGLAFFKMLVLLLSILAIAVLTVWIIKRWGHGRIGKFKDRQSIHILEKRVLSPKTILYLVEIQGARLLVSESQLEVRSLHQWQAPLEEEEEES